MYEVYVVATRPYPEKVRNGRYYINREDAERELTLMSPEDQKYFKVYLAYIDIPHTLEEGYPSMSQQ